MLMRSILDTSIQAAAAVETRQAPTVMNIKYINNVINR